MSGTSTLSVISGIQMAAGAPVITRLFQVGKKERGLGGNNLCCALPKETSEQFLAWATPAAQEWILSPGGQLLPRIKATLLGGERMGAVYAASGSLVPRPAGKSDSGSPPPAPGKLPLLEVTSSGGSHRPRAGTQSLAPGAHTLDSWDHTESERSTGHEDIKDLVP